jgi:phage gpG-like protein
MTDQAGAGVTVDASKAIKKLKSINSDLKFPVVLGVIGKRVLKWVNQNFKDAGTENRWAPLSPNTIANRRAGKITQSQGAVRFRGRDVVGSAIGLSGGRPLMDTGGLMQSFVDEVSGESVAVGTVNKIAKIHQEGTGPYIIRPKNAKRLVFLTAGGVRFKKAVRHPGIPARPMLPSKNVAQRLSSDTLNRYVNESIKQAESGA